MIKRRQGEVKELAARVAHCRMRMAEAKELRAGQGRDLSGAIGLLLRAEAQRRFASANTNASYASSASTGAQRQQHQQFARGNCGEVGWVRAWAARGGRCEADYAARLTALQDALLLHSSSSSSSSSSSRRNSPAPLYSSFFASTDRVFEEFFAARAEAASRKGQEQTSGSSKQQRQQQSNQQQRRSSQRRGNGGGEGARQQRRRGNGGGGHGGEELPGGGGDRHRECEERQDGGGVGANSSDGELAGSGQYEDYMALAHSVCFTPKHLWSELNGEGTSRVYRAHRRGGE